MILALWSCFGLKVRWKKIEFFGWILVLAAKMTQCFLRISNPNNLFWFVLGFWHHDTLLSSENGCCRAKNSCNSILKQNHWLTEFSLTAVQWYEELLVTYRAKAWPNLTLSLWGLVSLPHPLLNPSPTPT